MTINLHLRLLFVLAKYFRTFLFAFFDHVYDLKDNFCFSFEYGAATICRNDTLSSCVSVGGKAKVFRRQTYLFTSRCQTV